MDRTVEIGVRYFSEGIKRQYSNWHFAWCREVAQNSIDAGATLINIKVVYDPQNNKTIIHWVDNGCGMNADVITTKFMVLGESGKTNGVGGFGEAAALVAFAQDSYGFRTQDCMVEGQGSVYSLTEGLPYVKGVSLTVHMNGDESHDIERLIKTWAAFSTTKCEIVLNGSRLNTLRMHRCKAETEWCKLYTHNTLTEYYPRIWVRMNRQLMYWTWSNLDHHVVVDLQGKSLDYLTTNRDGMKYSYRNKLDSLIGEIYANPNRIEEAAVEELTIWRGKEGLVRFNDKGIKKISLNNTKLVKNIERKVMAAISGGEIPTEETPANQVVPIYETRTFNEVKELIDGHDVVIMNHTTKDVPSKWIPGTMNKHAYKLLNRWVRIVQFCGEMLGRSEAVSVGWIFKHNARAVYSYSQAHGHMILLNPVIMGETRFSNYWDDSSAKFYEMVSVAIHEICHIDHGNHDTPFATALTYGVPKVFGQVAALKRIKVATKI